jgi:hypothetical protein
MTAVVVPFPPPGAPARTVSRPRLPRRWYLRLPWWWRARLRARLALAEAQRDDAYGLLREVVTWLPLEAAHA